MKKPTPKKRKDIMDFHEMIEYSEQKHGFRYRDYKGLFGTKEKESHFDKYCRVMNDPQPFDGHYPDYSFPGTTNDERRTVWRDGKRRQATQEEYDADFKLIHEQYQRYKDWCEENPENEPPEYLDYWHWLLENHFYNVHNPCTQYWRLDEILDDEDAPDWVKDITQKVRDDFADQLDEDGEIEVLVEW